MLKRAWILSICLPALLPAALLRIEISERTDFLDGKSFASAGPYERIAGKAYFAVDPNLPANKIITDTAKAPRNEDGLVPFSADFYCLKRHGGHFRRRVPDGTRLHPGVAWLGVRRAPGPRRVASLRAGGAGHHRTGGSEIIVDHEAMRQSLGDRSQLAYPAMNPDDPALWLNVREHADAPRRAIARDTWHIEGATHIVMPAGFEPGKIYELVYTSKNPPIGGLGPAAVRDLISFFNYGTPNDTILGYQHDYIKRAYGFGISQSGRFLRTFLYYGFNHDEHGRAFSRPGRMGGRNGSACS